ncbi:globin domain-containing protein [Speluncibacter jeojiensis]|uniref:nitric oxide dioxygenase n=1 Tax=Speluncibacter jeojiensis TaxID=2710754 RepID=A0A9X4RC52_9ACTN|nr:FAD-binding oxidoreductase [Corynebacteriales bacterium D3-21]
MLSAKSTEVVRATLPAIGGAIGDITPLFYGKMFAAHPELEKDLFNRGNQAAGDQQRALAGAIAVYATILVDENAPAPSALLSRIANKHASLGITEDQYEIVYKYLFEAIVAVLGEAVTADVAEAWTEVYWAMANDLLEIERKLYADAGVEPGQVWQQVVVRRRVQESPDTVAFVLGSKDGAPLPDFRPGQYISVQVELADGAHQIRQYSLSRAPMHDEWRITVKAIGELAGAPAGEVSNFLHHNVFDGDELRVSLPYGDLVLDEGTDPVVLVSAGIGCTPMVGMLDHLVSTTTDRTVRVVHADRSPARQAHRRELQELVDQLPSATLHHWYEDIGTRPSTDGVSLGRIDVAELDVPADAQVYLCGPMPFMEFVREGLIGRNIPADNIHYEVFGPDKWLVAAG